MYLLLCFLACDSRVPLCSSWLPACTKLAGIELALKSLSSSQIKSIGVFNSYLKMYRTWSPYLLRKPDQQFLLLRANPFQWMYEINGKMRRWQKGQSWVIRSWAFYCATKWTLVTVQCWHLAPALQPGKAFKGRMGSQEGAGKVAFCPKSSYICKAAWQQTPLEGN